MCWVCSLCSMKAPQIATFMGPTWGPPGSCRPQMGPMVAPWILLSGLFAFNHIKISTSSLLISDILPTVKPSANYYKHNTNPWYELKTKRYPIFSHVGPHVWSIYLENELHIIYNKFIFVWQIALVSRSKGNIMLRVTGLCAGNSPMTGEFPAQRSSNAQNDSIWWRHHAFTYFRNIVWLSSGQNFADIILKRNVLNECFCAWFKFQ